MNPNLKGIYRQRVISNIGFATQFTIKRLASKLKGPTSTERFHQYRFRAYFVAKRLASKFDGIYRRMFFIDISQAPYKAQFPLILLSIQCVSLTLLFPHYVHC